MSRTLTGESLIFLLLLTSSLTGKKVTEKCSLGDINILEVNVTNFNERSPYLRQISIAGNRNVHFNITNVSSSAAFMIFQIHVYQHNVTLAYDEESLNKVSNRSVFGSNVGLFCKLTGDIITQLFVKNDNPHTIEALLIAIPYNNKAPVPGGCNMEFTTEVAPYARVQTLPEMVIVDVQPPSMPLQNIPPWSCGSKASPVSVEMYQMFLSEQDFGSRGYFSAISSMLTVQDIKTNGIEVASTSVISPMRRIFSAYTGVGSIYVAVAKYGENYAAYVPAFSYGCNPTVDPESCTILSGFTAHFICVLCFIVGLLLIILSHKPTIIIDEMIVLFFFGTVLGYMMCASIGVALLISFGMMILIVILRCLGLSFLGGVLHGTMTMGFFCACLIYYNSPGAFIALHDNTVFWTLFVVIACGIGVATLFLLGLSHLVTCSMCVALMVVLPIDYYAGSNLKYILINVVRRATVEDFHLASVQHPTQTKDILLTVLWSGLAFYHFLKHSGFIITTMLHKYQSPEATPLISTK